MISFESVDGRYAVRVGKVSVSQSAFMVVAAIVVGLGGGFGAVAFRALISARHSLAFGVIGRSWHPRRGRGRRPATRPRRCHRSLRGSRFAPEAKGHGVPEVMEAVALRGGAIRPRVIAVKGLASATSIGFGGSCGREGPIVQIGSAIGSVLGQVSRAPLRSCEHS